MDTHPSSQWEKKTKTDKQTNTQTTSLEVLLSQVQNLPISLYP